IYPIFSVIPKVREQPPNIDVGSGAQPVVRAPRKPIAVTVVPVLSYVLAKDHGPDIRLRRRPKIIGSRRRLNVIYASRVVIVSPANDEAESLVWAEAPAICRAKLSQSAPIHYRRVSSGRGKTEKGLVDRGPGNQVDRSADCIPILIGREGLVDRDCLDQVGRDYVQLDVAQVFGWRHIDAVDRHIAQTRLGAANLDVLAFTFVALERHAGQAADSIGDIS